MKVEKHFQKHLVFQENRNCVAEYQPVLASYNLPELKETHIFLEIQLRTRHGPHQFSVPRSAKNNKTLHGAWFLFIIYEGASRFRILLFSRCSVASIFTLRIFDSRRDHIRFRSKPMFDRRHILSTTGRSFIHLHYTIVLLRLGSLFLQTTEHFTHNRNRTPMGPDAFSPEILRWREGQRVDDNRKSSCHVVASHLIYVNSSTSACKPSVWEVLFSRYVCIHLCKVASLRLEVAQYRLSREQHSLKAKATL